MEGQKSLPGAENRTSLSSKANKPQEEPRMRESTRQTKNLNKGNNELDPRASKQREVRDRREVFCTDFL